MRSDEPGTSPGRILLIDDDRVFGMWVAHVVGKQAGYEFRHILDPASGLRCVETEPWDLVITDMEMPGMTGLELLERVRLCEPGLPVAVMTAHAELPGLVPAPRSADAELLHKPMPAADFLEKVAALIARGQATRRVKDGGWGAASARRVDGADGDAGLVDAVDADEGAGVRGVDHHAVADVDPDVVDGGRV
jgi:DNA-binding NtrC family response regulator